MIMDTIDRNALRERLVNEGYVEEFGLENTVDNLLNLRNLEDDSAYKMLIEWMKTGKIGKFEPIEGIDKRFLRDTLKMKAPAIILAYGMLLYDPKRNAMFLKNEASRRKGFRYETSSVKSKD